LAICTILAVSDELTKYHSGRDPAGRRQRADGRRSPRRLEIRRDHRPTSVIFPSYFSLARPVITAAPADAHLTAPRSTSRRRARAPSPRSWSCAPAPSPHGWKPVAALESSARSPAATATSVRVHAPAPAAGIAPTGPTTCLFPPHRRDASRRSGTGFAWAKRERCTKNLVER